jgi:DivIVA domain-containing protein
MSFSPEEIRSREFMVALRGYDKEEVATFLRSVADEYGEMRDALAQGTKDGASASGLPSDPFRGLGDQVASILRTATESAEQLRAESEQQANATRDAALREAARAAEEARLELEAAGELRAEAELQAAQLLASARKEAAETREAGRRDLEAARSARATAEREANELRTWLEHEERRARAEAGRRAAELIDQAAQEIQSAVAQVLQGCERLRTSQEEALHSAEANANVRSQQPLAGEDSSGVPR